MTKFEKVEDVLVYRRTLGFNEGTDQWYNFSHGSDVDDASINDWMQQAFSGIRGELLQGVEKTFSFVRSGNSMVLLTAYRQDDGTYELSFVVTHGYRIADISDYDPSVDVDFVPVEQ
jgi:hypothetical protein